MDFLALFRKMGSQSSSRRRISRQIVLQFFLAFPGQKQQLTFSFRKNTCPMDKETPLETYALGLDRGLLDQPG